MADDWVAVDRPAFAGVADSRRIHDANIPEALKAERRWLCWRAEDRDGKTTKVPRQVNGKPASTTNPQTWTDFDSALNASVRFDGIGFVLGDGWAGVDLDHCYLPDGLPSELAAGIVAQMNSYTEASPSGEGLHILFRGKLPGEDIPSNATGVEMYDGARYFTVTGFHMPGTPTTVEARGDEAAAVWEEIQELRQPANPLARLVVTAADIARRPAMPVEWLTDKFIECGELVLCTAPGGAMKSLLMLYWAACVASGIPFLTLGNGSGGRQTRLSCVLWVNTDNGEATHANRLGAMLRSVGSDDIPLFSITTTDFALKDPAQVGELHLLADDLGADVIVIDTLSGCLTGVNENSAEEMTAPAAHLRALASSGRTIVGIHHPPKADSNGSRGSSVLPNKVDRVFSIDRNEDLLTIKPQKVRNSPSPTFSAVAALETDPDTLALLEVKFFDGSDAKHMAQMSEVQEKIRLALEGGPLNYRPLERAVGGDKRLIKPALEELLSIGEVKVTPGKRNSKSYELT